MTDLFQAADRADRLAAHRLLPYLHSDAPISRRVLNETMVAAFGGTDAVGVTGFQCKLDGAAYVSCSSPVSYSALAIGNHTFQVRALDAAGNVDASPASFTWTIVTRRRRSRTS